MMEQTAKTGSVAVVAAAAVNVSLGVVPSYVRAVNVNNLAFYEFFSGMDDGTSLDTGNHADTQISVNAADSISEYAGRAAGASITGTAAVTAASATVTGTSTNFLGEVAVGDVLTINGEMRTIAAIASKTSLTVSEAYDETATGALIYELEGKAPGFTLGTDICDTASDVVRWLAIR